MNPTNLRLTLLMASLVASAPALAKGGDGIDDNPSADDIYVATYGAEKEDNAELPELTETEIENVESSPPPIVKPPSDGSGTPAASGTGNSLLNAWLAPNSGLTVVQSSIHYIGSSQQARAYQASTVGTLIDTDGIVMTTGSALFPDSNTSSGYTHITNTGASVDVSALSKQYTYDRNLLSFEFTVAPGVDAVTTKFVFASEEYPEWVGIFKDGFAMLVDGVNVARFDPTNFVVLDDCTTNGAYPCTDTTQNDNGFFTANTGAGAQPIEYDGYTAVLTATGLLDMTKTTHALQVVIADSRDPLWDSAVFLSQLRGLTDQQPDPSPVPVPPSVWLLGSAFAGLAARLRRRA